MVSWSLVLPLGTVDTVFPDSHILLKWEMLPVRPLSFLQFDFLFFFYEKSIDHYHGCYI